MPSETTTVRTPTLQCACGQEVSLAGKKVGDSVTCACGTRCVVIRSKTTGEIPAAVRNAGLSASERKDVAEALKRIKLRRVGQATRHVQLYPSWAVFASGVQFYLSAILAGQNLIRQGETARGRRVQAVGIVSYLVVGALLVAGAFFLEASPLALKAGVAILIPLGFASYFTSVQHATCAAARDAGAGTAPVMLPLLFGTILAIAQAFAIWFLKIQIDGPFVG